MITNLHHLVANTLHKQRLVLVASVITPHLFEVDSAERNILAKDTVDLLVIVTHDLGLVAVAALRRGCVQEWAHLSKDWGVKW